MGKIRINDKEVEYGKYLTEAELSLFPLSFMQTVELLFLGSVKIGVFQPEGFTAQTDFYMVRHKGKHFLSYEQGWDKGFPYPEVLTE